jgi:hypothetical protein
MIIRTDGLPAVHAVRHGCAAGRTRGTALPRSPGDRSSCRSRPRSARPPSKLA